MYGLAELRLFVVIATLGSISAAARQLQQSPAAASAALKRLEQALAVRLLERSTRALRLTTAGEQFLDHCRQALAALDEGETLLRQGQQQAAGLIRLAVPSDLAQGLLDQILSRFLEQHPQIRLQLLVADGLANLLRDQVDLAIRYGELADSRLVARQLCRSPQRLCAAPAYLLRRGQPRQLADLAEHDCLCYFKAGQLAERWRFFRNGEPLEVAVSGSRSADDSALVHRWAVAGHGLIYKAELDLRDDLATGRLVAIELDGLSSEVVSLSALYHGGRYLPARLRLLLDALQAGFSASGGATSG